jgi:TrmH family RNA methyltransferase
MVARYRAAAQGDDAGMLLLDGSHLVADALAAGLVLQSIVAAGEREHDPELAPLLAAAGSAGAEVALASAQVMAALSPVRSPSPIVALAERPNPAVRMYTSATPCVVIACDIQDPGNLGAIIRVAESAGASGVIAAGRGANPFSWKALRGSMGSALRLPIVSTATAEAAVADARAHGCRIVATVPRHGTSLFSTNLTGAIAVLIGSEGPGLPAALIHDADEGVTIPMEPPVESLNAAVSVALVVYEARRQRG